jgi:hypothetical protein
MRPDPFYARELAAGTLVRAAIATSRGALDKTPPHDRHQHR